MLKTFLITMLFLFSHIDRGNSGLSYDSIREIYQDSRGYVWIGTYKGLSRYDGTRFKNYDRDDFGVTSDFINVIREDAEGNLWIGTDNGVVIYNHVEDAFTRLQTFLNTEMSLPDDRIFAIERNSAGVMWISSRDHGLYSYEPDTGALLHHPLSDEGKFCNNIYRIAIDSEDNMYLAVYCDNIYKTDPHASSLRALNIGPYSDIFKGDDVEGLVLSGKSNDIIYVASKRKGLVEVDQRAMRYRQLYDLEKDTRPKNLIIDSNKYLWLSTTNGLVCYDLYAGKSHVYHADPRDCFAVSDNYITTVCNDDKGGLWVGTQYGGLNYYSPFHDNFTKCYTLNDGISLEGAIVRSFAEDRQGNLWVATERKGLLKYSDGVLTAVKGDFPQSVLALADDEDRLWIGSQKGISRMDYVSGKLKHYETFDDEDKDNRVVTIFRSPAGDVYVATTTGVLKYYRDEDRFEMLEDLAGITIEYIAEDSRGSLWLASYSSGVYVYDSMKRCIQKRYSPQTGSECIPDMISSVSIDDADNTWIVGFSSGFFRYDRIADQFREFSTKTFPSLPTDVFFMALPDDFGNLWLSSDSGLIEFNAHKNTMRIFTAANGLLDENFTKAGIVLRDGRMAFGSANGFVLFNPSSMRFADAFSKVAITDIFLDYESLDKTQRERIFSGNIDLQDKITLRFEDNSFGFSFATLESETSVSDKIFCRLEGYDDEWTDVSAGREKHWNNVPAGTYTMLLSNGDFSGNFVDAHPPLTIVVKPKFWASTLGILTISLIVSLFIFMSIYIFIKNQKTRERRRIEEYRTQKDKELLHEKMDFFSNIIHEIKTPLTLIHTPLQKILASGDCDASIKEEISIISSSTDYMNDLVVELLEYVRLEKHGYVLDIKNIDIVERTGFLCFNFYEAAKNKNIRLQFSHDFENLTMAVDTIAYRKIVNNMLDNGVKYAETYINVHMGRSEDNLTVTFSNDGSPIPSSRRESIFEPFVQFSADKSPYSQSFGIGLAYARNLAELHGGSLTLSGREDCTEFVLVLPITTVAQEPEDNETQMEIAKRSDLPLILIVEDNAGLITYLKKNLKHRYNVITSQSAERALTLLTSYKVDIILTDIALQGMSGVELCQRINSSPDLSHIPVIVVSAISSVETKMKCMEYGAANYIEKPYSMDYLQACIKGALEKRAALRAIYGVSGPLADKFNIINRDEDFLRRLEKVVLENMGNHAFSNKQLETMLYMGHSTLNRKMKALLDTTPNDYIRTKRLSVAADMLASGKHRVNEVCYTVGFNSPSYFAKCFKKTYGMLPAEWARIKASPQD